MSQINMILKEHNTINIPPSSNFNQPKCEYFMYEDINFQ